MITNRNHLGDARRLRRAVLDDEIQFVVAQLRAME